MKGANVYFYKEIDIFFSSYNRYQIGVWLIKKKDYSIHRNVKHDNKNITTTNNNK